MEGKREEKRTIKEEMEAKKSDGMQLKGKDLKRRRELKKVVSKFNIERERTELAGKRKM